MKCARCQEDFADNINVCPKCGMKNEFTDRKPDAKKKRIIMGLIALALLALIGIVAAVVASKRGDQMVLQPPPVVPAPSGTVTAAPPGLPSPGGILTAPVGKPSPGPPAPTNTPVKVPQAVLDYLAFVKGVEQHRQALLKDTRTAVALSGPVGEAKSLYDIASSEDPVEAIKKPLDYASKELDRQYLNWRAMLVFFDSKAAPAECRDFSGSYRQVVYDETSKVFQLATALRSMNQGDPNDYSKLISGLQEALHSQDLQGSIDQKADKADASLASLCSFYSIAKPFAVPKESGQSGNILAP